MTSPNWVSAIRFYARILQVKSKLNERCRVLPSFLSTPSETVDFRSELHDLSGRNDRVNWSQWLR